MRDTNLVLKTAGAVTTNTNHTAQDFGGPDVMPFTYTVVVTAVSGTGTPTLTMHIEESDDNSVFRDVLNFPPITAVGTYRVSGKLDGRYRRLVSAFSGTTPSFTFDCYPEPGGEYTSF